MQYTTLTVGLFAALATAHQHAPNHFHMRRALNATGPSTTMTVIETKVETVISCAPTVTDCPAHPEQATSEYLVTKTKTLAVTVCPVKDASSISSAIISGGTPKPIGTGAGPAVTQDSAAPTKDATLTYTLGTGESTTVITTTIKHTSTATVYATTTGDSSGEGSDSYPTGEGEAGNGSGEPTTTISSTATSTKYITVYPAPSGSGLSPQGSGDAGSGGCAPVTVTVSVAASTVTVTETAAAVCPTVKGGSDNGNAITSTNDGVETSPTTATPEGATPTDSNVVIIPSTATVIPIPPTSAPYGNGTETHPTTKAGTAAPSGFVTKPAYY